MERALEAFSAQSSLCGENPLSRPSFSQFFTPRIVSERIKFYIFDLLRILTLFLYPYFWFKHSGLKEGKIVLGSGPYYAQGWMNLEVNPVFKKDIFYDFRNRLPFPDASAKFIYSSHVFEHLFMNELEHVLRECYRVLSPGGILRICLPCLRKNIEAYLKGEDKFFQWEPEEMNPFKDFTIAAKFSRNVLVDGAHKNMYDFESLQRVLQAVGFAEVKLTDYRQSTFLSPEDLKALEPEELAYRAWNSFFAEARKS